MTGPLRPAEARARLAAAIAAAAVTVAYLALTPSVSPDAALGLLSVEQRLLHRHDALDRVVLADHRDLSHDLAAPITWWAGAGDGALSPTATAVAPGHQWVVYAWRRAGLTLGHAVKASAVVSWLVGIVAWGWYILQVTPDRRVAWWLIAAFACFRMSHYNTYVYLGGETLLWAAYPVAVAVNLRAASARAQSPWAFAGGALAVGLVALKPSAALLGAALGLWWLVLAMRDRATLRAMAAWIAGAVAGAAGGAAAGLLPSPFTLAAPPANYCANDPRTVAGGAIGGWLLGLSDANAALEWVTRGWMGNWSNAWVAALGAALAALFAGWYLMAGPDPGTRRTDGDRRALGLAVVTVAVVAVGIAALQLRDSCISFEGRHQQYGGYLALPLLASALSSSIRTGGRAARAWSVALALAVVALPAAYGAGALADKTFGRMPSRTGAVGADGLLRQWITPGARAASVDEAIGRLAPAPAVLVTTSPVVALAYPDRRVLVAWGPPIPAAVGGPGLAVLLPRWTEQSERDAKAALPAVRAWAAHDVGGGARLLVATR